MKINKPVDFNKYLEKECFGRCVLSLGCAGMVGEGTQFDRISKVSKINYGVDINEKFITENDHTYYGNFNKFNWFEGLPRDFDLVLFTEVLEHLDNPYNTLSYIYENMNSSTEMLISVPNGGSVGRFLQATFFPNALSNQDITHKYIFSVTSLRNLVESVGFVILEVIPYNQYSTRFNPFTNLASGFIFKVKK